MSNDTLYPGHDGHDPLPDCDCHPCAIHARNTLRKRLVIEEETCRQLGRKFREEESERKQAEQRALAAEAELRENEGVIAVWSRRAKCAEALAEQNAKDAESLLQSVIALDHGIRFAYCTPEMAQVYKASPIGVRAKGLIPEHRYAPDAIDARKP